MSDEDEDISEATALGDSLIKNILGGATLPIVKHLVESGAPLWYQDEDGLSALHAACTVEDNEMVEYLLANGSVWAAVDNLGNTAGDIALSLNNENCYRLIRDSGLRTEFLLSHLSRKSQPPPPTTLILQAEDDTAAGSADEFLSSRLKFTTDANGQELCLVQAGEEEVGVMMGWERGIMQETVKKLFDNHPNRSGGLKVLNIGFGLGIIDTLFQQLDPPPQAHAIIEAHPDVLAHMRSQGWDKKLDVTILSGKWQDVLAGEEIHQFGGFDVVYIDTFSECYQDLREFFDFLPDLLDGPDARFGFFNGLGATNVLFYDVYSQLAELHLGQVGLKTTWSDVDLGSEADGVDRWGETRKYFSNRFYRLPISSMSL